MCVFMFLICLCLNIFLSLFPCFHSYSLHVNFWNFRPFNLIRGNSTECSCTPMHMFLYTPTLLQTYHDSFAQAGLQYRSWLLDCTPFTAGWSCLRFGLAQAACLGNGSLETIYEQFLRPQLGTRWIDLKHRYM